MIEKALSLFILCVSYVELKFFHTRIFLSKNLMLQEVKCLRQIKILFDAKENHQSRQEYTIIQHRDDCKKGFSLP